MELTYFNDDVVRARRKTLLLEDVILSEVDAEDYTGELLLAVHLHLFYVDMVDYVIQYLRNIPQPFDLFISIPIGVEADSVLIEKRFRQIANIEKIELSVTPNRGRDIAPMLCTFKDDLRKYDVFLHIHTKRSLHNGQTTEWSDHIFQHLLPSENGVKRILSLFQKGVDMVTPPSYFYVEDTGWGKGNKNKCQELLDNAQTNVTIDEYCPTIEFPQGSMFYSNYAYLSNLFELPLTYDDFPQEPIGIDGTIAHAIERLLILFGALKNKHARMVYKTQEEVSRQQRIRSIQKALLRAEQKNLKHLRVVRILIVALILAIVIIVALLV